LRPARVTPDGAAPRGAEPNPVARARGRAPRGAVRRQDPRRLQFRDLCRPHHL